MDEKEIKENVMSQEESSDNVTNDVTNEQIDNESSNTEANESDNMAEELAVMKDSYLRLMAEYDNYRKRTIKEKAELIKNGGESVLIGLLPVIDDFERALGSVSSATDTNAVIEGINLIYNKFISFLGQNGVKAIDVINKPFNEEIFDAVATIPAPEEGQKGKVIDCVQTGYYLNEKVIRHPKVVVAE